MPLFVRNFYFMVTTDSASDITATLRLGVHRIQLHFSLRRQAGFRLFRLIISHYDKHYYFGYCRAALV